MDHMEKEATVFAFSQFIKETNLNMSPGSILFTTLISIYTPKFIYVFYTKRQQHIETLSALEKQIELLQKQNELLYEQIGEKN